MTRILTAIGLYVGMNRFSQMMLADDRQLPACARVFRWVLYLCLSGVAVCGLALAVGFVMACLNDWGVS